MAFDGSINAIIGADISAYTEAMGKIVNTTSQTVSRISETLSSTNGIIQKVGQVMSHLAEPLLSSASKVMPETVALFEKAGGQIQRTIASIGEKIPQPFKTAFQSINSSVTNTTGKISGSFSSIFNSLKSRVASAASKVNGAMGTIGNSLGNANSKFSSFLSNFKGGMGEAEKKTNVLKSSIAKLAIAVGGLNIFKKIVGGIIETSAKFEQKISNIKAVTGASNEEMKKLKDASVEAGAKTAYSASEAADAIGELSKAGVSTKDILNGGLTGALNLATAGDLELKDSAEIASTALNAFKKDNLTVVDAANQLAGAANASATDVGGLKYGLSMVSAVASGVGLSFNDTTDALAVFAQNGLKGSDAGTSLKTMLQNLQPTSKAAIDTMQQLGLMTADGSNQFFDAQGNIKSFADVSQLLKDKLSGLTSQQQQAALKTMFGSDAVRAATIAMNEGAEGAKNMQNAISKVTAADVAKEKLNNLKGSIENLRGGMETMAIRIGEAVLPALTKLVSSVSSAVSKISSGQGFKTFLDNLKGGSMAAVPIIQNFGKILVSAFKAVAPTLKNVVSLIGKIFAVVSAHPDLFKSLAVGVLGAVTAFKALRTAANIAGTISAVKLALSGSSLALEELAKSSKIAAAAQAIFNSVMEANPVVLITMAIAALVAGLIYFFTQTKSGQAMVTKVWNGIKSVVNSACEAIGNTWNSLTNFFTSLWSGIKTVAATAWGEIKNFFSSTIGQIVLTIINPFAGIANIIFQNWNTIKQGAIAAWTAIGIFLSTSWQNIVSTAAILWTSLTSTISNMVNGIVTFISTHFSELSSGLQTIWSGLVTIGQGAWNLLKNTILGPVLLLIDLVSGNFTKLASDAKQIWNNIVSAAKTIWNGLATTLFGIAKSIYGLISGEWSTILVITQSIFSKVVSVAISLWNSLIQGILNVVNSITEGVTKGFQTLLSTASNIWNTLLSLLSNIVNSIGSAISNGFNNACSTAINIFNSIKSGISEAISSAADWVGNCVDNIKNFFNSLQNIDLASIGSHIIQGLINGVTGKLKGLWDTIGNIGGGIAKTISNILDIHSPSRVMAKIGGYVGEGLVLGMASMQSKVDSQALAYANTIQDQEFSARSVVTADTRSVSGDISSSMNELSDEVENSASSTINLTFEQKWDGKQVYNYIKTEDARNQNRINLINKK